MSKPKVDSTANPHYFEKFSYTSVQLIEKNEIVEQHDLQFDLMDI